MFLCVCIALPPGVIAGIVIAVIIGKGTVVSLYRFTIGPGPEPVNFALQYPTPGSFLSSPLIVE